MGLLPLISAALVGCVVFVLGVAISGRPIVLPDWARDRVSRVLAEQSPHYDIDFGKVSLVFEDGFHPRLQVQNVAVGDVETGVSLELAEIDTTLSLGELASGRVAPRSLSLVGATLTLRREADGSFNLAFGEGGGLTGNVSGLGDVGSLVERLFKRPELAQVSRIEAHAVSLRYDDVRAGQGWTIDGAEMRLDRDDTGARLGASLSLLGGRDYASQMEVSLETSFTSQAAALGFTFTDMPSEDIALQSPALAWLGVIRAPISGAVRVEAGEDGALLPMNATLQIAEGVLRPNEATRPVPFQSGRAYLRYDPTSAIVTFQEVSVESEWVTATGQGRLILKGDNSAEGPVLGNEMLGQFTITHVTANPLDLYAEPLTIEETFADLRLRLDPFEVTLGQLVVRDRGHLARFDGRLWAGEAGWELALFGAMDRLDPKWLVSVWPENAKGKTRKWIDENILGGWAENLHAALHLVPGKRPDLYVDFGFHDADVKFAKTLPPAENAVGYATLMDNRFSVYVEKGTVLADAGGRVDATGTVFEILDTRIKKHPPARVGLKAKGSITAGLSLLDREPLSLMTKNDLPVTLADGRAEASGELRFNLRPKLEPGELKFDVAANLSGVRTGHFVRDKVIASSALKVRATNDGVRIGGRGRLGELPFNAAWQQLSGPENKGKSHVSGTVRFSENSLRDLGIELPGGWIGGEGQGQMEIRLEKGEASRFTLTSDLAGLDLTIPPLGWRKGPDQRGRLKVEGWLGDTPVVDRLELDGQGLEARGRVTLAREGGLKLASFDRVRLGNWLDVQAELRGQGPGVPPQLVVQGGKLDMRGMPARTAGETTGGATGGPIRARLEQVQISDGIALRSFSGEFTDGGRNGVFIGRVNGGPSVTGAMTSVGNRSAFRIKSDDAGAVFAAAGLLKSARGGVMDLTLLPHGAGSYDGELKVTNTRVREAPAIAELLNAISVVGLLEQMNGQGIAFNDVYARFRMSPDRVTVAESSAVGASMGISMDGHYYPAIGAFDMQGVLSPIYLVNAVGRPMSKRGEGLIGFNYNLRGDASDPQVSVNPLSALTPGFFREIFRRPAPNLDSNRPQN
ncbi:DUF3971 domain-containing protein [Shimia biformata]|uniref:YhdP family protein n=1 Tax=Shimia biformata TaxID=1294299 RepID=UPI00195271C5|nr:DUF3971 domain-containing protein [Shimia biformata]